MPDYYVNKSGNDGNSGADHANAFLTLAKAFSTLAPAGAGTIYIGSGVYNEKFNAGMTTVENQMVIQADGYVVIDGHGLAGACMVARPRGTNAGVIFNDLHIVNWADQFFYGHAYINFGTADLQFNDCRIEGCGTVFYQPDFATAGTTFLVQFLRCEVFNNTKVCHCVTLDPQSATGFTFKNSCFVKNDQVCDIDSLLPTYSFLVDVGNVYEDHDYIYDIGAATAPAGHFTGAAADYGDNFYKDITHYWVDATPNDYTTLAQLQAGIGGGKYGGVSQETDPLLVDVTNGVIWAESVSPIYGVASLTGNSQIGPLEFAPMIQSNAYRNPSAPAWTVGGSLASDAGTQWVLISGIGVGNVGSALAGSGVIVSPVFDMGAKYTLTRFRGIMDGTYPANVIDYDKTDTEPNRRNLRYRISDSPFNQNDAVLSWTTVEWYEELVAVAGRYIQFELTFRNDGVAA